MVKKLLIYLTINSILLGQNPEFKKPYIVISLGYNCVPASFAREFDLIEYTFPFDWLKIPFNSLYKLLITNFANFLTLKNLVKIPEPDLERILPGYPHQWLRCRLFDIDFIHDFKKNKTIAGGYKEVKEKYQRRIARFYRALNSEKHIIFIRFIFSKSECLQLVKFINIKFPKLKYTILAINPTAGVKTYWKIKNVINFYVSGCEKDDWFLHKKDLKKNWQEIFTKIKLIKPNQNFETLKPITALLEN